MSFWELLALAGIMSTILGAFITAYAIINGRNTRKILTRMGEGLIRMGESFMRMEEGVIKMGEEYIETRKELREILIRMEQGQDEARKEMAEAIKYLGQLIVSESEKTRKVLKAPS